MAFDASASIPVTRDSALIEGLRRLLPAEQVPLALRLWEEEYSARPGTLRAYADRLVRDYALNQPLRDVHRLLVQHLFLPQTTARPAPPPPVVVPAAELPPLTRAFVELLEELFARFAQSDADAAGMTRHDLADRVLASFLERPQRDALIAWLEQSGPAPVHDYPPKLLRALVHLSYVGVCNALGPLPADRLLAAAIRYAEYHTEGVRQLL